MGAEWARNPYSRVLGVHGVSATLFSFVVDLERRPATHVLGFMVNLERRPRSPGDAPGCTQPSSRPPRSHVVAVSGVLGIVSPCPLFRGVRFSPGATTAVNALGVSEHRSREPRPPPPSPGVIATVFKAVESGAGAEDVSLQCCRLVERLESGHAMQLRVDGELLDGVYSTGGAQQKRQELLDEDETGGAGGACGGGSATIGDGSSTADGSSGRGSSTGEGALSGGCGGGGGGGGGGDDVAHSRARTVEVVPWEAAGRLLLACPFATKLPVLRYARVCFHPDATAACFFAWAVRSLVDRLVEGCCFGH